MPSLNLSDLRNIVENKVDLADIVQTNLKPIQNELDLADIVQTNLNIQKKRKYEPNKHNGRDKDEKGTKWTKI